MDLSLTRKLEEAVTELTGPGSLKDRLAAAYCRCLEQIDQQDLPEEVQHDFATMSAAMHRARALPGDTIVRASVRKLSREEAQAFARLVVRMYSLRVTALVNAPAAQRSAPRSATPLSAFLGLENAALNSAAHSKVASRA